MRKRSVCTARQDISIPENNEVGAVVETITVEPDVTLAFNPDTAALPFRLEGNQLIATERFDYETTKTYIVNIICSQTSTSSELKLIIIVFVTNVNDNPPVFDQDVYRVVVSEMSPVDTVVGSFPAKDLDTSQLYYTLTSESNDFKLRAVTVSEVLVNKLLEYDKVKNVQLVLYAQDTPLASEGEISFTATTTIMVSITDRDDRPPWFQPCTKYDVGGTLVCQSSGYTGRVNQNEQEAGVLELKPGPLYAIDGDSGINEEMSYSILSGNDDNLFEINPNTGNITMLKPVTTLEPITLTVMAAQKVNSYQFTTTSVIISVQVKSLHRPQFESPAYEAILTGVGSMAMDLNNKDKPLVILATDDDYTEGVNPYISYSIDGSNDFNIINGHLFMTKALPDSSLSLTVVATDTSNDESATAPLSVTVTSGLTTTSLPLSTTDIMTTTSVEESTTDSTASTTISTTSSSMSTEGSVSTINPTLTSEGSSTASTVYPPAVITPSGGYGAADMAAIGATLGVLLFICLVVIGVLVYRMLKEKGDWKKINEASMFQSSLGQGSSGNKEGIQYTNEGFNDDEDGGSIGSHGPAGGSTMAGEDPRKVAADLRLKEAIGRSSASLHAHLPDDTSQDGSDKADSEKDVKPILTKERRMEEGYKAVWFKEDIDPNAKQEVVIIPDSREDDSEDEDEEQRADLDSGLGVKMEDPSEDTDSDDMMTSDL
ncbi:cadherin-related family member 5-like [Anabas testudineus]|uniref:cadherin-related family member 5-like n=1 Tax=Anabas testudineus TaxID=64144 RepID=UPI000E454D1A|nr:cadherin-related family member 5-like [Anabas testudineus]